MFKSQLINKILISILVPVCLALVFGYMQVNDLLFKLQDQTHSEITKTMKQIEREFQFVLETSRQLSETIAVNAALVDALEDHESDYLFQWGRRLVRSNLVNRVTFVDNKGTILARGHEEHRFNDSILNIPVYSDIDFQKPYSGLIKSGTEWTLTTITPVFRFDILHRGSIIIEKTVTREFLDKLAGNYDINRIQIWMDFDPDAKPIEPRKGFQIGTYPLQIPCSKGLSCSMTITKDLTVETNAFRKLKRDLLVFVTTIILAAIGFILSVTTRALRPIREMHDHLLGFQQKRFTFEELIQRIKGLRQEKTEMGVIATSVSETLVQLQQSQTELKIAHGKATRAQEETLEANEQLCRIKLNLEDIVNERTSELLHRTEQLKSEVEERNRAEQRYRLLVENATDAIFIIQRDSIWFPNPKALEMFGYEETELTSTRFLDLVSPEDRSVFSTDRISLLPDEKISGIRSFNMIHSSKKIIRVQMNSVPTAWEGESGLLCFIRDITEYRRTQEILIQSEKMLSIGGLAAGMAHEINNPLAGMMQNAQMAMNRLLNNHRANEKAAEEAGTTMDAVRKYAISRGINQFLNNVNQAGEQAARIVDNMLSFARKSETRQEKIALDNLIIKTLELVQNDYVLENEYDFKQIKITTEFDTTLPPIACETSKIQQVIFNIIRNAAEAMSERPHPGYRNHIIIRTRLINGMAQIEIEDNGPGMDEAIRKRIFEPFFTTKSVDKGTGLGLSVSYFIIVENHNGEMEVVSKPELGTNFVIRLPLPKNISRQAS